MANEAAVSIGVGGVGSVTTFRKYGAVFATVAAVAMLYLIFHLVGIGCPIKFFTGVSCAGCGMTRAWMRVLHLDFLGAWNYHPLYWTVPVGAAAFLLKKRYPTAGKVILGVIIALFVVVYIARMLDPDCTIVVFEPHNSLFYRIVHRLT